MIELRSLSDLEPHPRNPREITDAALAGLGASIAEYGDLSGIVWNKRNGKLVCGHQRIKALVDAGATFAVLASGGGSMFLPGEAGERFPVRVVDWPEEKHLAAMVVAMPILTIYSDVIGILGGAIVSRHQIGVSYNEFYDMMRWALALRDVAFGLVKAVIFGVIITIVSCEQGFSAKGGAEGVGKATMRSVVYSFLLILIANFLLFSLVYRTIFTRIWN